MQLQDLSPVLSGRGPFVTVLVGTESAVEQAADRDELAWKAMGQRLEQQGVAAPVRAAIAAATGEHAEGAARLAVAEEVTVKGRTLHLKKVQAGAWAHHRHQHRAEDQWRENAGEVRETAVGLAEAIGAQLIIGVGDDREPTFVEEAVVEALRKAQVQTLLITTEADQSAQLFFGEDAGQLGLTREEVSALGASTVEQGGLVSVPLRAALATGADVQLVPHQSEKAPAGGVTALLRYTDDSTATS